MVSDIARQFAQKYESLAGVAHHVRTLAEAAGVAAAVVQAAGAQTVALAGLPKELQSALEKRLEVNVLKPPYEAASPRVSILIPNAIDAADLGITAAAFAIADAGALVEVATDDVVRLVSTLPRIHICFLPADQVVATLEQAAPRLEEIFAANPKHCVATLISGPSRTGDIEMKLTLGVHGPEEAHAVLVEEGW